MGMLREPTLGLDSSVIEPDVVSMGVMSVTQGWGWETYMRKGERLRNAGVPMDRLTVTPDPSGVSCAYTDLMTDREVDMLRRE